MKTEKEIDDLVDQWHDGDYKVTLSEFLGMTNEEYSQWLFEPMYFIDASKLPPPELIACPSCGIPTPRKLCYQCTNPKIVED